MRSPIHTALLLVFLLPTLSSAQDSLNVSLVAQIHHNWDFAAGIDVQDDIAYVATFETGLRILDVSDPTSPVELGYFFREAYCTDVKVSGNTAYVLFANDEGWADGGLSILDISDPSNPEEIGLLAPNWIMAYQIELEDSLVYIVSGYIRIVDVSDPTDPEVIGEYFPPTGVRVRDIALFENYLYAAAEDSGTRLVDISDPTDPVEVTSIPGAYAFEVAIMDTIALIACVEENHSV